MPPGGKRGVRDPSGLRHVKNDLIGIRNCELDDDSLTGAVKLLTS